MRGCYCVGQRLEVWVVGSGQVGGGGDDDDDDDDGGGGGGWLVGWLVAAIAGR